MFQVLGSQNHVFFVILEARGDKMGFLFSGHRVFVIFVIFGELPPRNPSPIDLAQVHPC